LAGDFHALPIPLHYACLPARSRWSGHYNAGMRDEALHPRSLIPSWVKSLFSRRPLSCSILTFHRVFVPRAAMDILIPAERIQMRVGELAQQIAKDYHDRPITIVGVLTGSLIFLADLIRHLDLPLRIGLIQASSYRGAATAPGKLQIQPEL